MAEAMIGLSFRSGAMAQDIVVAGLLVIDDFLES